jgi:hypothetical protein
LYKRLQMFVHAENIININESDDPYAFGFQVI